MALTTPRRVTVDREAAVTVSRLALKDFRCFADVVLSPDDRCVVLTGPNGVGKTAMLEALSLLVPGGGLRGARLADIGRRGAPDGARWAVAGRLTGYHGAVEVGTGLADGEGDARRVVRIDGRTVRGQAALAEVVGALWLTPAMDRLFADGASARRRFFDRLVVAFDPAHAQRIGAYERALRERARLLRDGCGDAAWLTALEATMAGTGVAVAAARRTTQRRLAESLAAGVGPFPGAEIALDGAVEASLDAMPAVDAEAHLAAALAESRLSDARTGGAAHGPHRSDFVVHHRAKGLPAAQCSTGEQKALLIAVVLATAARLKALRGIVPLLLLDEVVAHLDGRHRDALFESLAGLGAQAWLTGTDRRVFDGLGGRAQYFSLRDGLIATG